jgi:benzoyl-CoA reductase/2-hydroxyglutaryl-CoA dehydratase subunit BcrC/BadD/HgdB
MLMPKEEHTALLEPFLEEFESVPVEDGHRPRLYVTGNVCDHPPLLGLIEDCGAVVVGDDLCTGTRYFDGPAIDAAAHDPVAAVADFYLGKPPCAVKCNYDVADRGETITAQAKELGADAVIFLVVKFCAPHNFEYPLVRDALKREGIPHLLLEYEWTDRPSGQLRTRLNAFVEML